MDAPFETTHTGKCNSCGQKKPLDMMSRADPKKGGVYDCLDCKIDKETRILEEEVNIESEKEYIKTGLLYAESQTKQRFVEKLMRWAFG